MTLARVGEVSLKEIRELAGKEPLKIRMFFKQFCPKRVQNGRMTPRTVQGYEKQATRYLVPAIANWTSTRSGAPRLKKW